VEKLEQANNNPTIRAAREEIARVRRTVETQVAESNRLIDRLRNQLGKGDTASVETLVNEQQDRIKDANTKIETLTKKKYELQAEFRKLEVEVGPIKYIAELIYDTTDQTILEKAVRWVIILIVVVFDPLAVMMLLAATESRSWIRGIIPPPPLTPATEPAKSESVRPVVKYEPVPKRPRNRVKRKRKAFVESLKNTFQKKTEIILDEDIEDLLNESEAVKEAKRQWKADNPDKTLKEQRHLLAQGSIDHLPWETYLPETEHIPFGQLLPDNPVKGYQFLNTGYIPSKLFKYNGNKWIEVDKTLTDSYAYNTAYIEYLMDKIVTGEYDPELLSPAEQEQIELKLKPKGQ
jgi:hypothetical protein